VGGVLDTSLLLYAANGDAPENAPARELLTHAAASSEAWYLTEGICYEFLRVSTHPAVFSRPLSANEAMSFLEPLLEQENFRLLSASARHWEKLRDLVAELHHPAGNLFFDIRTAALMREHGVRKIYTSDKDFLQFAGVEAIDPVAR
jgi:toxin-antitoxin system PIN domain toxin